MVARPPSLQGSYGGQACFHLHPEGSGGPSSALAPKGRQVNIVASCGDTSYDAVRNIWKSSKGRKLREALGLYSGDPRGFWDWVGEQVRDKGLLSDHVNLSDMDPDWR